MANRSWGGQRLYTPHVAPVLIDCSFKVASSDSGGLGITGLKGTAYVQAVYMHTSATAAAGNPNPNAGYIYVQLVDNYSSYMYSGFSLNSANSGSNLAVNASNLTAHIPYVITVLGTSTTADWVALGVPSQVVPAVGVPFVAKAVGAGSGSGQVQLAKATGSGISHIELIGDPSTTVAPTPSVQSGSLFLFQCLGATASGTTTFVATAPADGTVIGLQFYLSNHSVSVGGQF